MSLLRMAAHVLTSYLNWLATWDYALVVFEINEIVATHARGGETHSMGC